MKYLKRFNESQDIQKYNNIDITGSNFMEIFEDAIKISENEIDQISDIWINSDPNKIRKVRESGESIGLFQGNACEASIGKLEDDWYILYDCRNGRGEGPSLWKCDQVYGLISKIVEIWGYNP